MYTLKLLFHSDIKGVYTQEEETATDFDQVERKKLRMLQRWTKVLYPKMPFKKILKKSSHELSK